MIEINLISAVGNGFNYLSANTNMKLHNANNGRARSVFLSARAKCEVLRPLATCLWTTGQCNGFFQSWVHWSHLIDHINVVFKLLCLFHFNLNYFWKHF